VIKCVIALAFVVRRQIYAYMKTTWSLTKESFEKLLTWLDSNREEAATKYESARLRLIKYFICNGCGDRDEELADETIDRVARRLERNEIPEPFTGDKILYFLAFARNIRREHLNDLKPRDPPPPVIVSEEAEDYDFCLEKCLQMLVNEDHSLADLYYSCEKSTKVEHHKKLAKNFGLSLPGLRTRIHRIRERLRPCIEKCLEERQGVKCLNVKGHT